MKPKIGDVVIERTYIKPKGKLGIVIGGDYQPILLSHSNGITMDKLGYGYSTWEGLEVIGHIELDEMWKKAEEIKKDYDKEHKQ